MNKRIHRCDRTGPILLFVLAMAGCFGLASAGPPGMELEVSTTGDAGPGSLRAALETAAAAPETPARIHFGPSDGLFSSPQTITLASPLPIITGQVTIDGFLRNVLWQAYGATLSAGHTHRIFEVAPSGSLRLTGITLSEAWADSGGAILNHGRLVIEGVSLFNNRAATLGGAIANHGELWLINSTLAWNEADRGGGLAHLAGEARLINVTLYQNRASAAASVWSLSDLHLANSILAGSTEVSQCFNTGPLSPDTTHNLIQGAHEGCGEPILTIDPRIEDRLGYYNGPTPTLPIGGASPVVNLGLNSAAVDDRGQPLRWDQRGNGDPRFAGGFTDLGAFERQGHLPSEWLVDTLEDTGLRACSLLGEADCPLRAALELAGAARQPTPIRFHPRLFDQPRTLLLPQLPEIGPQRIVLDGQATAGVIVIVPEPVPWATLGPVSIEVREAPASPAQ